MTTQVLRTTLNAVEMPFLYRDASRATLLPGMDQVRNVGHNARSPDWNIPQMLYCENVMPIAKGIISTATVQLIPPAIGKQFDQGIILRDARENNTLFCPSKGANYLLDSGTGTWNSSQPFSFQHRLVTRAYTQGRTFIGYDKEKIFEYDGTTNTLIDRTSAIVFPDGFSMSSVRGIGGGSNYLLLFTDIEILWSSPSDPLNFNRTLNNGSGYQTPQDLRGQISCILPVSGGVIVYSVRNAVAGVFTSQASTPFLWKGITNAGGVASQEQVAFDADEQMQYIWGSGGLQAVSLQTAASVFPEVADMLSSNYFEYFDYTQHKVVGVHTGSALSVKLTYVAQRFVVISYGRSAGTYEYALIYDVALDRWGKIKVAHVDAFTYPYPNISGDLLYRELNTTYFGIGDTTYTQLGIGIISISPAKKSIAFLNATGSISILSIDYSLRSQVGTVVIGQLQHNRNSLTSLHSVEVEGLDQTVTPHLYALLSSNGKTVDNVVEYLSYVEPDEDYQLFQGVETAKNVSIAVVGAFQMTGLLCKVSKHAKV